MQFACGVQELDHPPSSSVAVAIASTYAGTRERRRSASLKLSLATAEARARRRAFVVARRVRVLDELLGLLVDRVVGQVHVPLDGRRWRRNESGAGQTQSADPDTRGSSMRATQKPVGQGPGQRSELRACP
eukprot:212493-Pleurochrysis_carterae.AAC.9